MNEIVRIVPTLKVNNRKLNEKFYIETLGMETFAGRVCLYFSR